MGLDFDDTFDSINDLAESVMNGDIGGIAGDLADVVGDVLETAAPVVSMFNPALGAAMAVGGSVLNAVEDGKVTFDEVVDIGKTVIQQNGWGGFLGGVGKNFEAIVGLDKIVGEKVTQMVEKLINGESITDSDVDFLSDLISLLNQMNMKEADRAGRKGGEVAAGEGGGEGGEAAGGTSGTSGASGAGGSGASSASGGSIFQIIAQIFGEKMEEALGDMLKFAEELRGAEDEEVGKLTPQFTAAAQQFSFLSQSFNTGIAALGEGLKSAARKQ